VSSSSGGGGGGGGGGARETAHEPFFRAKNLVMTSRK